MVDAEAGFGATAAPLVGVGFAVGPAGGDEDFAGGFIDEDAGIGAAVLVLGFSAILAHVHDGPGWRPSLTAVFGNAESDVHVALKVASGMVTHVGDGEEGPVFGSGNAGDAEGVAMEVVTSMDAVSEAVGQGLGDVGILGAISKMDGGDVDADFVEELGVGSGADGELENVISSGDGEGAVNGGVLFYFRSRKCAISGAANVGEGDLGKVVELRRTGKVQIEFGEGLFAGSGQEEFEDGGGRTVIENRGG